MNCPTRSAATAIAACGTGIRRYFADMQRYRVMGQNATRQLWHEDYFFTGGIPAGISVAVIQIRVEYGGFGAVRALTVLPRGLS